MTKEEAIEEISKESRNGLVSMVVVDKVINNITEGYWHTGEPTEDGKYLVTMDCGAVGDNVVIIWYDVHGGWAFIDDFEYCVIPGTVKAWMPLPNIYEVEN